jgi:purine-nucleoside phosphorylase
MELSMRIKEAAAYLRSRVSHLPEVGLVLGSGLGDYADTLEEPVRIAYGDIPHFPVPTVAGHSGALIFGRKWGRWVVAMQGRIHYYEGLRQRELTLPIRVMAALGVKTLVLTNACGGVNLSFAPGDLMLISDHINYSGDNPLIGENLEEFGPRFPDMSDLYTASVRKKIRQSAAEQGISLQEGVYAMYSGPNYETLAEIRMLRIMGADTVGMSTVPEALVAGHCGMQVVGISCITNMAAGVLPVKLSHAEVMETADRVHDVFRTVLDLTLQCV